MARAKKSRHLRKRKTQRKSRATQRRRRTLRRIHRQRGGMAQVPDYYFPPKSIVSVRDADDEESPFFSMQLEDAERDFIAAADRPQDPYGPN